MQYPSLKAIQEQTGSIVIRLDLDWVQLVFAPLDSSMQGTGLQ